VLDEWSARALFGSADAVGRTIDVREGVGPVQTTTVTRTVIGIAADTGRGGSMPRGSAALYVPFDRDYGSHVVFAVRARGNPEDLVGAVQQTLRQIDPDLVARSGTGPAIVGSNAQFFEISAGVASLLGGFAWILALVGLYGVLSHLVIRRTREIGIRSALGASRRDITRMVVIQGLGPVVAGVIAGLGLAALVQMALRATFLRLAPAIDWTLLVVVPLLLLAAAFLACYVPARRAASVNPNAALRQG